MAYSSAALSADQLAWQAKDYPLILAANQARQATTVKWRNDTPTDANDSTYPPQRVYDGKTSGISTPTGSTIADWYLYFNWTTGIAIDCGYVINHNMSGITVDLEIADDAAFTTNALVIDSVTPGTGRFAFLIGTKYSNVEHARLVFNTTTKPQIGEVLLGSRMQANEHPWLPWAYTSLHGNFADHEAHSGEVTRYAFYQGKRIVEANFHPWQDAREADWIQMHADSNYGQHPVIWSDEPNTDADNFIMGRLGADFEAPAVGPFEKELAINIVEQGPHYQAIE